MRNFKLLLATTAILSTGLMTNVWADTITSGANITIQPSVSIITPINASPTAELRFGTIISPKKDDTVIIGLTAEKATGTATLLDNTIGDDTGVGSVSRGKLVINNGQAPGTNNYTLRFPDSLTLLNGTTECGTVTFEKNETPTLISNGAAQEFTYGGTFKVGANGLSAGNCSNSGTVTLILEHTPNDGGGSGE